MEANSRLDTIMGRTDDMMKIKGVNVFPSQIEEILKEFSEVSSEYQIRISHLDGKDTMRIYVETNGTVDFQDLSKRIASVVKSRIGIHTTCKKSLKSDCFREVRRRRNV